MVEPQNAECWGISDRIDHTLLIELFRSMVLIRNTEETTAGLLEGKEIRCPTHLYTGQEAIAVGVCAALGKDDYIFGGHRSHGHYLAKGGDLNGLMAELYGKATGCALGRGGSMHLVAPEVGLLGTVPLVAATIPIAVGAALASKLRHDGRVAVAFFGDGATEEGHFHESINLAAVYRLPVIFVCENNLYSSHMHILERRAEDNIVQTGRAHGVPGVRVDGNDVEEVYGVATEAAKRARGGGGATLLECRTYRWRGHVGPSMDMDVGVQRRDEVKNWLPRDPIQKARTRLLELGVAKQEMQQLELEIQNQVQEAVEFARRSPHPHKSELSEHVFVTLGEGS